MSNTNNTNNTNDTKQSKKKLSLVKKGLFGGVVVVAIVTSVVSCVSCKSNNKKKESSKKIEKEVELEKVTGSAITFEEVIDVEIADKFYLNEDDKKSFLTILNLDYIITNYPELLKELYPNGLNVDKEIKDFSTVMSKIREYNTEIKNSNEFMTIVPYAKIDEDKAIFEKLEKITKELIDLVNSNGDKNRINEIFDLMYAFNDGKDIILDGETINKDNLSNGGSMTSELYAQIVSVITQNFISEEKRAELDNKLNASDGLFNIKVLLETYGNNLSNVASTYIDGDNTYILDETDKQVIKTYEDVCKREKEKLSNMGISITDNELESLVLVRNVDYLASDNVSAGALKAIVGDDNVNAIIALATSAIEKIEEYNKTRSSLEQCYLYSMVVNPNDEEELSNNMAIKAAVCVTFDLRSSVNNTMTDVEILNNSNYQFVKLYNAYNSKVTINGKNGEKITKNDIGSGTNFITDGIYWSSLKTLSYQNEGVNSLVNNTNSDMSSINPISWAIENKCSGYQFVK